MIPKPTIFAALLTTFGLPLVAFAQVEITEVMYDREGTDSGYEWVEIQNTSSQSITLTEWVLVENDVNHRIQEVGLKVSVAPGEFAVIADSQENFFLDFPDFNGAVFDSAFSLNNTGELITMNDSLGKVVDSVLYEPLTGANGNGASLQKQKGGTWIAGLPTPGLENTTAVHNIAEEEDSEGENNKEPTPKDDEFTRLDSDWPFENEHVYVSAGENQRIFVGEEIAFVGEARFKDGDSVHNADFVWAFGDGEGDDGEKVEYRYEHPGVYSVVLLVDHDGKTYRDRVKIHVIGREGISLGEVTGEGVEVVNSTEYEVDLSGWRMESESSTFDFAPGTHILPEESVEMSFGSDDAATVYLLDSNNNVVDEYVFIQAEATPVASREYQEILEVLDQMIAELKS